MIAKYDLPKVLYTYGSDTFFDRLFETLSEINDWEHFKNNLDKLKLSLKVIDELIDIRYDWEDKWITGNYGTVENATLLHLWWWSRYSRFTILIFIFLHRFQNDNVRYIKLFIFNKKLVKVYLIYSIRFQKSITYIHTTFNNKLINEIVNGDFDSILNCIETELKNISSHHKENFKKIILGNITYSQKVKNILCRLSAALDENIKSTEATQIINIREKLFYKPPIDIEHIQSFNDEENKETIWEIWGENINSIGNLVVLEENINRSISNKSKKKLDGYQESKFEIVNNKLVEVYPNWNLESCKKRKDSEVQKIMNYLFE